MVTMKRILALLLAFSMLLCLWGCKPLDEHPAESESAKTDEATPKSAFELSKEAYECINRAYDMINTFSSDIYEAWYKGVYDDDEIDGIYSSYRYYDETALETLAAELTLSVDDLKEAVKHLSNKSEYDPGTEYRAGDWYNLYTNGYGGSIFSACVALVYTSYELSGKADEIKAELEKARENMKLLSDSYSDYEHYPSLKEYFTNTTAFFGFCLDPEGSFAQVEQTFNSYRNLSRDLYYDLNYIFEEELFPEETDSEEE